MLLVPMSTIPLYSMSQAQSPRSNGRSYLLALDATKGFGRHLWDVPPENLILLQQASITISPLKFPPLMLPALLLLRDALLRSASNGQGLHPSFLPSNIPWRSIPSLDKDHNSSYLVRRSQFRLCNRISVPTNCRGLGCEYGSSMHKFGGARV